jgi:hypothetical protein
LAAWQPACPEAIFGFVFASSSLRFARLSLGLFASSSFRLAAAAYGSALLRLTSDFWSLLFLPLPTDSVDVLNQIKMPVIAENMLTVLEGKRRNPNVIFRNRSSGKTQAMADNRVLTGRLFIHRKHAAGSAKSTEANLPRSSFT